MSISLLIKTLHDDLKEKIKAEIRQQTLREVQQKVQQAVKQRETLYRSQLTAYLQKKIEGQLRAELEPQLRAELEPQLRAELEPQLRAELEPQLRADLEPQLRAELEPQLRADLEDDIKREMTKYLVTTISLDVSEADVADADVADADVADADVADADVADADVAETLLSLGKKRKRSPTSMRLQHLELKRLPSPPEENLWYLPMNAQCFQSSSKASKKVQNATRIRNQILSLLQETPHEPHSLVSLAATCQISRRQAARAFSAEQTLGFAVNARTNKEAILKRTCIGNRIVLTYYSPK